MTDNEIIKALECCKENSDCENCRNCTGYASYGSNCLGMLIRNTLDLINRPKAEIEKKDIEIDILIRKKETLKDEIAEKQAEIEKYTTNFARVAKLIKTEAYKEFAERLKENIIRENDLYIRCAKNMLSEDFQRGYEEKNDSIVDHIDNLLTELTERKADAK